MASVNGRQRPDMKLVGPDNDYHPNTDGYWDKDAMLNNCSAMQLTAIRSISKWEKFFKYFWTPKGEGQQLQTPGMMIITLTENQKVEQRIALKQGFTILHHFPSCHGGYLNTVFVKNNPNLSGEDNKLWQKYLKEGKESQARMMAEIEAERANPKPIAEGVEDILVVIDEEAAIEKARKEADERLRRNARNRERALQVRIRLQREAMVQAAQEHIQENVEA